MSIYGELAGKAIDESEKGCRNAFIGLIIIAMVLLGVGIGIGYLIFA